MGAQTDYIGYRHWNRIRNSGDAITPHILEHFTGLPARSVNPGAPHILGVGSILFLANKQSLVWGSGILNPTMPMPGVQESAFYAIRGKKTEGLLRELKVPLPDVPLGDPGIFAHEICNLIPAANRQVKYRAAFVPHHSSTNHPLYRAVRASSEFVVVDILSDTLLPLEQILQSEVVVSQSLHGLIYAESLGKPSLWISERHDEIWRFKFDDWLLHDHRAAARGGAAWHGSRQTRRRGEALRHANRQGRVGRVAARRRGARAVDTSHELQVVPQAQSPAVFRRHAVFRSSLRRRRTQPEHPGGCVQKNLSADLRFLQAMGRAQLLPGGARRRAAQSRSREDCRDHAIPRRKYGGGFCVRRPEGSV